MRKIILLLLVVIINISYSQINYPSSNKVIAKTQQASLERTNGSLNSVNSLPEQDLAGAIPVCQPSYSVLNSYVGSGLISEIASNTCLLSAEKNSVWYSFTCFGAGRLKYMITPNDISDDYDYALYDLTGHSYSDIQNGIITPIICNFSAGGGKTGLDSSGVNANEPASGPNFNPLINLIQGHNYVLNISNFSSSTFGYFLSFSGTTANIGSSVSSIQSVVSYCGSDSITVNLSSPVSNSSIANNGSDFILTSSTGTYNVVSAYGVSGTGNSSSIVLKLGSLISTSGTFSLGVVTGTDGNTLLNTCSSTAIGVITYTFNNTILYSQPAMACQGQTFTLSALSATSYTWAGAIVPPGQVNNQNVSITTNTNGNFTFTLQTTDGCGISAKTFSVIVNPTPNTAISYTSPVSCANVVVNLQASGATSYAWMVSNSANDSNPIYYQTQTTSSNFLARPLQQNIYTVVGTNMYGCSTSASQTISVLASPSVTISGPDTICAGAPAILTFSGIADTYTWSTGAITNSIVVTPSSTYNYYINTSLNNGCSMSYGKFIFVKNISISSAIKYICLGDSVLITAPSALSYTWSTGATTNTIYAKPTVPTTYTVSCNTSTCGVLTATSLVTFYAQPNIPISMSNTICSNSDSVYVFNPSTTAGLTSYTWSTGSHSNIGSSPINLPYSSSNNVFSVSVAATNSLGCIAHSSLTYSVFPKPKNIYVTSSTDICSGNTATLTGHGADTYKWSYQGSFGTPASPTYVITQTATTTYYVYGISNNGCYSDQVLYTLGTNTTTTLSAVANPSVLCSGLTTVLYAQGSGVFHWFASDTSSTILSMNINYGTGFFNAPGTYTYYVSSTCSNGNRVPVIIQVNQTPTITVTAIKDSVCSNAPFQLNALGANTYTWTTGNIVASSATYSIVNNGIGYFPGYYQVIGKSLNGCSASKTKTITSYPRQMIYTTASPTMVCAGMPSTVSVLGVPNYTWSTGVVSNTTVVYPNGTYTTATYTALNIYGCNQVESIYVPIDNSSFGINFYNLYQCTGTTTTLSVNGYSNYTWNTGLSNANLNIANISPGVYSYSVNGTNINGCARQSAVTYTVIQSPTVLLSPNYNPICSNASLYLTVSGGADSYTVTTPTYTTTNIGFSYGTISSPITFTTVGKRTYLPTYNWTCYTTYTNQVQVLAATSVSLAPTNTLLCFGETATLTALGVPNYTFSGGPINSPYIVTPSSTTNYLVTGKDGNACVSTKAITLNVNSSAFFSASSSQTICSGQSVTLNTSINGSLNYNWQPSNVTTNSIVVSPLATTIYSVTGTNTICALTRTVKVTVNQTPTVSLSTTGTLTCINVPVVYATASPSVSYFWYRRIGSNNYSLGAITNSIAANQVGDYYCTVTNTINSCSATASISINVDNSNPPLTYTVSSPICRGSSAQISVDGAATYNFNYTGTTTNTLFVVSPLGTTTYSLVGIGNNGCAVAVYPQVIVNSTPTVSISGATPICSGTSINLTSSGANSYTWNTGATTNTISEMPNTTIIYSVTGIDANNCIGTASAQVVVNTATINVSDANVCEGQSYTITPSGASSYTYSGGTNIINPTSSLTYTVAGTDVNNCIGTATLQINVIANPTIVVSATTNSVCEGSSASITASGADSYSWSTGDLTSTIIVIPSATTIYSITGGESTNNCSTTQTISITVDNTCTDVWPGDANSDGVADNLDVLELGLHYTQTGVPRATTSNNWQPYFANNWTGTITNGKNLNHSDCNGDGIINDDDTLAIFNNYGLTHTFKSAQTNTINPQITIVPDQSAVVKGTWGSASIYLGDASTNINNINGVAFTVDFDNTLIEPSTIWIEYQNSFIDASQNLYFRKLDFASSKLFTASTHTISNNVSGYGKIGTLHYQILSSLATDQVLNIGLSQANQSNASGIITPLTTGAATVMALGASVGINEIVMSGNVLVSPNPTNGILNISFNTLYQSTKIELYNSIGALVLSETISSNNSTINLFDLSSGIYFMKVKEGSKVVAVKKVVKQ